MGRASPSQRLSLGNPPPKGKVDFPKGRLFVFQCFDTSL